MSLGRQFVRGEFCQKGFQGRDAEFQVRVGGGLGQPPGARQLEAGFGDPRRRRIGMRGQQVLPDAPRVLGLLGGQRAFAHPEAGFDRQRLVRVFGEKRGEQFGGAGVLLQLLTAARHAELRFRLRPGQQAHLQRFFVERHRRGVIRCVAGFRRMEEGVAKLAQDVREFLFPRRCEQRFGFGPVDRRGPGKVVFGGQCQPGGEPGAAVPGAGGELVAQLLEGPDRSIELPLQQQGAAFQVQQVIAGTVRLGKGLVDGGHRRDVIPVLQQLADVVCDLRRISGSGFRGVAHRGPQEGRGDPTNSHRRAESGISLRRGRAVTSHSATPYLLAH